MTLTKQDLNEPGIEVLYVTPEGSNSGSRIAVSN